MTEAEPNDSHNKLDGLSVERAADVVGGADDDPDQVRETLAIVAEDGVISRAAVDDALTNASMVVTTAETRVELAGDKLDSVQAAATSVSDLQFVSGRIDNFEARLTYIEERADDLGDAIQEVIEMKEAGSLYQIARRIKRVTNAASEVQRAADDLQLELDAFTTWLTDADRRVEELTADIDALSDSVTELADVVETLDDTAVDDADHESEAASRWVTAMVRHSILSVMIRDLKAEYAAVQTWAERENVTPPSEIESKLNEVQAGHAALEGRLTERAASDWMQRFDEQLTALDEALGEMTPPVVWADVDTVVAEHRPVVE